MTPFSAGLLEAKRQGEQGAPKIPVTIYRAGEKFTRRPVRDRGDAGRALDSRADVAGDHHAGRHRHPHRRLEDRSGADDRPARPTRRVSARYGDKGVLALICNSTNAHARRRVASEAGGGRGPARASSRARRAASPSPPSRPMSAASSRIAESGTRCRPPGAGARPLAEARHRCRRRARLHGRRCRNSSPRRTTASSRARTWSSSAPAARASRGRPWPSSSRDEMKIGGADAGRHGDLLLAHHPRQREGDPRDQEPA